MSDSQWDVFPFKSPPDPDKKDLRPAGIFGFVLFTFIGLGIIFG
jgi:hypothetical protein